MSSKKSADQPNGATETTSTVDPASVPATTKSAGKGRPTPTRKQAEAARKRPLVPADRKAAKRQSRLEERERRYKIRLAMEAGEEWALPRRDRGTERRFMRDWIDARRSFAEYLLIVMVLGLPVTLITHPTVMAIGYSIVYGAVLIAAIDVTVMWFQVKKAVTTKFGAPPAKGGLWYTITRALQMRVGRVPKPQVKRGQYPS
ncbi:DUF3043 domain-containing protein [Dermatophilus congolensis]|uniref:Protein of uncharacterized function (DUF3043) n=1 Tax=Dermatophilus congolensis TaxID=1863 RepID=A0A239VNL3_9MICO|nr:DUF3043 domain-containing protein [Dermatophilus congolensis]SNV23891.1 Protein of uncharacterised function (DUF3043) [Dermatophilus congolensis]